MEDNFQERNDIVNMVVSFLGQPDLVLMRTCLFSLFLTGVLYHRWGKHSKAEKCYTKALQLDPQSENVHENLEKLKRTKRHLANGRSKGR